MEKIIVVIFAVVVLAMLALIWLLRFFFKNYQHRSEGTALQDVSEWTPAGQRGLKRVGLDLDLDWTKL